MSKYDHDQEYKAVRKIAHEALDKLLDKALEDERLMTGLFDIKVVDNDGDRDEKGDVEATYTTYAAEIVGTTTSNEYEIEEMTKAVDEDIGTDTFRRVSLETL
jgi:hypothetical protein